LGEPAGERIASDLPTLTPSHFRLKTDGAIGGGQIGCNVQSPSFVYGWEADLQSGIGGSKRFDLGVDAGATASILKHELDWFGTVRARSGFTPTPELLLYVTGGLAYGEISDSARIFSTGGGLLGFFTDAESGTRMGWVVGGGAEAGLPHGWSLKAEYLYVDLGSQTLQLRDDVFTDIFDYRVKHRYHIFRVGLNKRFSYTPPPITVNH
jgi:outer membrane immunogenic protein